MIISIKNDEGITSYDVNKIENEELQNNARITINKVGTLEVLLEALNLLPVYFLPYFYRGQ